MLICSLPADNIHWSGVVSGAEIKLRNKPLPCEVVGWPHITRKLAGHSIWEIRASLISFVRRDSGAHHQ